MNRTVNRTLGRMLAVALLVATSAINLSCDVNEYCLNCERPGGDGGPGGDATDGGGGDGGGTDGGGDAGDGGTCVPSGMEVCDGDDNDCDGNVDEGALPTVGDPCDNQMGECAGGVKQCTSGVITCTRSPEPELCDLKDNNCNGQTDEGDPGGGAVCGTNVGECVAGFNRCVNGQVECVGDIGSVGGQVETCNNRDDDCDGNFDEGITNIGPCTSGTDQGECAIGTLQCIGGSPTCVGAIGPTFELCDTLDQDCDGDPINGYNLAGDPQNCGACGNVCNLPNAFEGCGGTPTACTVVACEAGYHDVNGVAADGCEYGVCTITGSEVCDDVDNDCNGTKDDGLTPPTNLCLTAGACAAGSTVSCAGAQGFTCTYASPDVSLDAQGVIVPETECDGIDNDCDGRVDEGQPNLGQACDNGQLGECRSTGTYQCNAADRTGPAVCVYTQVGAGMSAETCDGKDNNCNGQIDDGAATGNLAGQEWITIAGSATQIMKYEASRPDAGSAVGAAGTLDSHVCSTAGRQPWTNVTHPQAEAACASIGARLCTESEWFDACDPRPSYPLAGPAAGTDYVFVDAEDAHTIAAGSGPVGGSWVSTPTQNYSGTTSLQASPNNDNNTPAPADAPAQAPRMHFQFNLQGSTTYYVWVRMLAASNADDTVYVGLSSTLPGTVNAGQAAITTYGTWVWTRSTASVTTGAAGNYFVHVYQREDGVLVDGIALTRSNSLTPPPIDEKTWAVESRPKISQPTVCNGDDLDTNPGLAGDQDDILPAGSRASCFANGPTTDDAYDLSGNVKEWAQARTAGENPIRGGASNNEINGLTCGLDFTLADDSFFFPNVGFRCCR